MSHRTDRLRAINTPRRVEVERDAEGRLVAVTLYGGRLPVEAPGEVWRLDDEWWRQPISRRYYEVVLQGGRRVMLYEDLVTGEWWMQKP